MNPFSFAFFGGFISVLVSRTVISRDDHDHRAQSYPERRRSLSLWWSHKMVRRRQLTVQPASRLQKKKVRGVVSPAACQRYRLYSTSEALMANRSRSPPPLCRIGSTVFSLLSISPSFPLPWANPRSVGIRHNRYSAGRLQPTPINGLPVGFKYE